MTTLRKAARQEHQLLVARPVRPSRAFGAASLAATLGSITMIRFLLFAAAARAVADLHALAPVTREEHRPAVKRSAERAAKASRLLADEDGDEDEDCATKADCEALPGCDQPDLVVCYRGSCYTGTLDARCDGQDNGFDLGDGGWCWNGRRDQPCYGDDEDGDEDGDEGPCDICDGRGVCLLYTSPSPRDGLLSRMPSSA